MVPRRDLASLLVAEVDDRERRLIARRVQEAHLPRLKLLEDFDCNAAPQVSAARLQQLAEGGYLARAELIILIGDSGTGKTHLATGLCVAACRQQKRARFITAAGPVNELIEAQQWHGLGRVLQRWSRLDLIVLDEGGATELCSLAGRGRGARLGPTGRAAVSRLAGRGPAVGRERGVIF